MTQDFGAELGTLRLGLDESRAGLEYLLRNLGDENLGRERRGSWSIRRVLDHVWKSELLYAGAIGHLRGQTADESGAAAREPASVKDWMEALSGSRARLLAALEGVEEEEFYRLRQVGHEEYSVLSVLENVINHDHEHAQQIAAILNPSQA